MEEVDLQKLVGKRVLLAGFDGGVPSDALRAALRLVGEWAEANYDGRLDLYEFEGVVTLEIDGSRVSWVLRVDPDDGYRSHLAPVVVAPVEDAICQFDSKPILVEVRHKGETKKGYYSVEQCDSWEFVDVADGHVWLEFGTRNTNGYYPIGYVDWHPKES